MRRALPLLFVLLAACAELPVPMPPTGPAPGGQDLTPAPSDVQLRAQKAARQFVQVVETVEPVAEQVCRNRSTRLNCDFQIVVDDRPDQPPNAFQTVDRAGRPIVAFNLALIASAENADELAFVMGHEAAHHVMDHIAKTQESATVGAVVLAGITALSGADADTIKAAEELGATVGARTYSKDFELEADRLGTIIAAKSGYDPVRGALFFNRIPDPGNRFLGSHPPNAARMAIVRKTYAEFVAGQN
ncbi:M48 family metallopeptidase [Tropicibacter oceani]|uniref:M48 family metallopeptidase n=1 Tax=Tropicibacter oceani TaxID=3058420 RepID=A0ABY8QKH1_9RHOB|nr:M48 family metallopeptidase [Tropicibacter oceani]WGW05120.1 M48 family metallopeptidase [Tropicibacter oceani]